MEPELVSKAEILVAIAACSEGDPAIGRMISTARVLHAIQEISNNRATADEDLVNRIAEIAFSFGCSVVFDHRATASKDHDAKSA